MVSPGFVDKSISNHPLLKLRSACGSLMARKINLLPLRSHLFCEVHQSYCYEDKYIMMNMH